MASLNPWLAIFCPNCEAILPLPGHANVLTCKVCKLGVDASVYDGLETRTKKVYNTFNPKEHRKSYKSDTGEQAADGPVVNRKCSKCGHDQMSYATLQLRSADEGQTIFYTCLRCKAKEIENS